MSQRGEGLGSKSPKSTCQGPGKSPSQPTPSPPHPPKQGSKWTPQSNLEARSGCWRGARLGDGSPGKAVVSSQPPRWEIRAKCSVGGLVTLWVTGPAVWRESSPWVGRETSRGKGEDKPEAAGTSASVSPICSPDGPQSTSFSLGLLQLTPTSSHPARQLGQHRPARRKDRYLLRGAPGTGAWDGCHCSLLRGTWLRHQWVLTPWPWHEAASTWGRGCLCLIDIRIL